MNAPASSPAPAKGMRCHVLVVDDTPTNRQILSVFLKKLGHTVDLAVDGADAVAKFAATAYDIVIMDVMMPVMDGYEATRRIKAMCGDRWVPVIFLSALDKDENLVTGLDAGGDDYLPKPVNFVILEAKLRSLTRTLTLHRELDEARRFSQALTDNLLEALITIDEHGLIETANPATTRIFGYRTDELVGCNVSKLMPEPTRSAHDAYLARYTQGGEPHVIGTAGREVVGQAKDGRVFPLQLSVSEFSDKGRRMFAGTLRDITKEKEAEVKLRETAATLQVYHDARKAEDALASEILEQIMQRPGLSDPRLRYWISSASSFSGDILAATTAINDHFYVLLADATGHGLAAAISVLPLLTQFYDSAGAGVPLERIIYRINTQLCAALPVGRFIAASFICLDQQGSGSELWLGGMPAALVVNAEGKIMRSFDADNLPLGVDYMLQDAVTTTRLDCPYLKGAQLVFFSDGLIEAQNAAGEAFGMERLSAALASAPGATRFDAVKDAVNLHLGTQLAHDDISLVFIDLPDCPGSAGI